MRNYVVILIKGLYNHYYFQHNYEYYYYQLLRFVRLVKYHIAIITAGQNWIGAQVLGLSVKITDSSFGLG